MVEGEVRNASSSGTCAPMCCEYSTLTLDLVALSGIEPESSSYEPLA